MNCLMARHATALVCVWAPCCATDSPYFKRVACSPLVRIMCNLFGVHFCRPQKLNSNLMLWAHDFAHSELFGICCSQSAAFSQTPEIEVNRRQIFPHFLLAAHWPKIWKLKHRNWQPLRMGQRQWIRMRKLAPRTMRWKHWNFNCVSNADKTDCCKFNCRCIRCKNLAQVGT